MSEMSMYFENLSELLAMAGHGPYVWASYGFTFLVIISLIISPLRRSKKLLAQQQRIARREAGSGPYHSA